MAQQKNSNSWTATLKADFPASIVVFLVAVPLCLGIALASGAPLFSGIIAGIIGGIVVGALSGSSLGVSGPAAGLAVIVLGAIEGLGGDTQAFQLFLTAVVLSGIIQLVLGYLKAGIIGYYFPSAVIKGMLTAIGVIIILKQIPHALGYDGDYLGDLSFLQLDGRTTLSELVYMFDYLTPASIIITVVSLAILIVWEQPFLKRQAFTQIIQGPLLVVVAGIGLNLLFQDTSDFEIAGDHLVTLPVAGSINEFLGQFTFPDFTALANPDIYAIAFTLAVVASLETLLSVEATDKLDPLKRVTPTNRELKAQGVGNILSGLIGGLPITQVIVRSSANIQSGGVSKLSAILHGVLLLISVIFIPHILNLIPLASLAAILLVVGFKLAKPKLVKDMYKQGWEQFIPFIVTVLAIVFTDLLYGILIGLGVGIVFVIRSNYHSAFTVAKVADHYLIRLNKDVNFIHKSELIKALNRIPDNAKLIIDGSKAWFIDHDVAEMIEDFIATSDRRQIDVELVNFNKRKIGTDGQI